MTGREEFLLAYHALHPGGTPEVFAAGRTIEGDTCYGVLTRSVLDGPVLNGPLLDGPGAGSWPILDLGCGDGYLLAQLIERGVSADRLIGLDMSQDELRLAHRRRALADCALICARGQDIPLPDSSVGAVISHLAFMLMADLDAVVAEIVRVLTPGGAFATIIGGGPRLGTAFDLFLDELRPLYRAVAQPIPALVDTRLRTDDGIRGLLGRERGFAGEPIIDDFYLNMDGDLQSVWTSLLGIYEVHALDDADRARLRAGFENRVAAISRPDGSIPYGMAMRLIRCWRAR